MSDFVDFNLAKKLKEKGFKFNKDYYLDRFFMSNEVNAPITSQVLKWLRNEYNILVSPSVYGDEDGRKWNYAIVNIETFEVLNPVLTSNFASFEETAIAGIEYVLDNLI